MSVREAAEKWGISTRRVQALCECERIAGLYRLGNAWAIPVDTLKPVDARTKNAKVCKEKAANNK